LKIKEIMKRYDVRPSKRLGQHFLMDESFLYKMIKAAEITKEDEVLEIGPGLGVLTLKLADYSRKVVAVEKDGSLIKILEDLLKNRKNVCLINEDVLKLDLNRIKKDYFTNNYFKIVANLPYYITSPILMKVIENRDIISKAVVMVQKEVAERLASLPGSKSYGILSIAVQLYSDVEIVSLVGKGAFFPPPKVDSAIVKLDLQKKAKVDIPDEKIFFKIVEAAFAERRKTVKNSLKNNLELSPEEVDTIFQKTDIDGKRRAETLSIEEFASICRVFMELKGMKGWDKNVFH